MIRRDHDPATGPNSNRSIGGTCHGAECVAWAESGSGVNRIPFQAVGRDHDEWGRTRTHGNELFAIEGNSIEIFEIQTVRDIVPIADIRPTENHARICANSDGCPATLHDRKKIVAGKDTELSAQPPLIERVGLGRATKHQHACRDECKWEGKYTLFHHEEILLKT
jgi:hypothetical protein